MKMFCLPGGKRPERWSLRRCFVTSAMTAWLDTGHLKLPYSYNHPIWMALEIAHLTWPNIFISKLIFCHQYDDHHAVRKSHDMKIIQRIFDGDVLALFLVNITSDNQYKQATSSKRYILREEFPYCIKCYENVFANNYNIIDIWIFIICIYIIYYMQKVRPPWGVPLLHQVLRECLCQQLWRMWQDHWHWLKGEHEQYVSWKKWLNITIQFWEVQFNSISDRSLALIQSWEIRRLKKIDFLQRLGWNQSI